MLKKNRVSIIITTRNEEAVLEDLLKSIGNQSYKDIEIIVVDNNSEDRTVQLAGKYTRKIFNFGTERSSQRNYGVSKAIGRYVLILDADMKLEKDVIKECVDKIESDRTTGSLVIPEKSFGKGFWAKFKIFERGFYVGEENYEAARFFRKELFQEFGGYDIFMTGPEDWDLPLRMRKSGIKISRIRSFIFHNEEQFNPLKSARRKFYYASHAWLYLKRHPEMIFSQGNLLLRLVFLKNWREIVKNPGLSIGMFSIRILEMLGAFFGIIYGLLRFPVTSGKK